MYRLVLSCFDMALCCIGRESGCWTKMDNNNNNNVVRIVSQVGDLAGQTSSRPEGLTS